MLSILYTTMDFDPMLPTPSSYKSSHNPLPLSHVYALFVKPTLCSMDSVLRQQNFSCQLVLHMQLPGFDSEHNKDRNKREAQSEIPFLGEAKWKRYYYIFSNNIWEDWNTGFLPIVYRYTQNCFCRIQIYFSTSNEINRISSALIGCLWFFCPFILYLKKRLGIIGEARDGK